MEEGVAPGVVTTQDWEEKVHQRPAPAPPAECTEAFWHQHQHQHQHQQEQEPGAIKTQPDIKKCQAASLEAGIEEVREQARVKPSESVNFSLCTCMHATRAPWSDITCSYLVYLDDSENRLLTVHAFPPFVLPFVLSSAVFLPFFISSFVRSFVPGALGAAAAAAFLVRHPIITTSACCTISPRTR